MEPEKRLVRGSIDSSFYWSRAGSRSNSIHNGCGYSIFNSDNPQTPSRNSPADTVLTVNSGFEITPLDLQSLNVAIPIPAKHSQKIICPVCPKALAPQARETYQIPEPISAPFSGNYRKNDMELINELIERFLEEESIAKEDWECLKREEQIILNCLIKRKLGVDIQEYIKCKAAFKESMSKSKRLEENYKMVFKGALKHLGCTFKEKKEKKKKAKSEDIAFYQYYFGSVTNDDQPIESFFHPNKYT